MTCMSPHLRGLHQDPALMLLYDPENNYTKKAYERAKHAPRVLIGGSKNVSGEDATRMINKLVDIYRVDRGKIYMFPGHEKQLTSAASGLFLPAYIPNSKKEENQGSRQERVMPLLRQLYGERIENVFYIPHAGAAFEVAHCWKPTKEEELEMFKKGTRNNNFHWYYQEGGSGQELLPLDLVKGCFDICKEKGKNFIVGGGIKTYDQAKTFLKSGIKFIVMSNVQLENWGPYEIQKIQSRLYTARDISDSFLLYSLKRQIY